MEHIIRSILGIENIRRQFVADERARSQEEATLFVALTPYIADIQQIITDKEASLAVTPQRIAQIALGFAAHVEGSECVRRTQEEASARALRTYYLATRTLAGYILSTLDTRGASFRGYPEIRLRPDVAQRAMLGILTVGELVDIQPSAFILKE